MKTTKQLGRIAAVKDALARTPFTKCPGTASQLIFGAATPDAELSVRQYMLVRLAGLNLNEALLRSIGENGSAVVYALPLPWREVLREHGFKVAEFRSAVAWASYVLLHLAYGAFVVAKRAGQSAAALLRTSTPKPGRFAFFYGLARNTLPPIESAGPSHDIISWYLQWPGRIYPLDTVCHTVAGVPSINFRGIQVLYVPSAILPLRRGTALLRFIAWGFAATAVSVVDVFRGRWWHALLLNEAASAAIVRHHAPDDLARDYLFHNSAWVYRPLWTYEAAKHGSRVSFYFYSTNCENFKLPEGYPLQENAWHAMNWPFYMVWDDYQAEFVRRSVGGDANISVVGPIWFQAGSEEIPPLPSGSVAVFDVEPHRTSRYQVLGASLEYFVPETAIPFLLDIRAAVADCGGTLVLKRKRRLGKQLNRRYTIAIDELSASDGFMTIDPEIAATRLIECCAAVISMPFTSTALLGRQLGKPSAFYDPRGIVQKDDRAAHGIEILAGPDELRAWVASVLTSDRDVI